MNGLNRKILKVENIIQICFCRYLTMHSLRPYRRGKTKNRCWLQAASGRYKGHVDGVGLVNPHDGCVKSYL